MAELVPGLGVGPAGFAAANLLRLSTQIPRKQDFAVPMRAPTDLGSLHFVSRNSRTGRVKAGLRPREVALLEVLSRWEDVVEEPSPAAEKILQHLLRTGTLDAKRLAAASVTEPEDVKTRLAELLTTADRPDLADLVARPQELVAS
ncbi:hypothetical protein [Ornithinimicrobium sp. INDO-MA30-4]|uniref:hypothetical protein n=1 Tax=Ornithinimicrobium sp. INDO-MA30-4 TaxID=2908651 RepID=UPI001F15D8F8|nr:hypothetical protein [Ornithinimicrobium sp. INDO-MA30-4]UJH71716.1 hypothetical protein L0A91_16660 [Ornithinimicrobium sp. INDO-MA30-4]